MISVFILWYMSLAASNTTHLEVVTLEQLNAKMIQPNNDTLYVVNFWATWCKPCVTEMPYFEKANATFASQKVKVIFVSLNYAREKETVEKFIRNKKISSACMLLDAGTPNNWIDKIEPAWSGSIPSTIMYKRGKKVFFREGEFAQTELDSIIKTKTK